jgi:hypothetical protein
MRPHGRAVQPVAAHMARSGSAWWGAGRANLASAAPGAPGPPLRAAAAAATTPSGASSVAPVDPAVADMLAQLESKIGALDHGPMVRLGEWRCCSAEQQPQVATPPPHPSSRPARRSTPRPPPPRPRRQVPHPRPRVVVISGSSGVGKDSVIAELRRMRPDLHFVITATSRCAGMTDCMSVCMQTANRPLLSVPTCSCEPFLRLPTTPHMPTQPLLLSQTPTPPHPPRPQGHAPRRAARPRLLFCQQGPV